MSACRACGGPVTRRTRVYCSNACQRDLQRQQRVERWLTTGSCVPDTHGGHYVREHVLAEQRGACAICRAPAV